MLPSSSDPYAAPEVTNDLLAAGRKKIEHRLCAQDMLTTVQASIRTGESPEALAQLARSGVLIGIHSRRRGLVFPEWQFHPRARKAVVEVAFAFRYTDGWQMLSFFESPHVALDGVAPKAALATELSIERIVELASARAHL